MRVAEIMTGTPTVLHPSDRLDRAAEEMRLGQIHHLPVVDRNNVLVGILSHRDLLAASSDLARRADEVMITDVKSVGPETPAHEAAYLLLRYGIGSVPVTDDAGVLVGIVTEADFVRVAYRMLGGMVPVDQMELEEREADRV
jgi:CBS domain-containing protein